MRAHHIISAAINVTSTSNLRLHHIRHHHTNAATTTTMTKSHSYSTRESRVYLLYFINCNVSFEANFVPRDSPELRVLVWAVTGPFLHPRWT